MSDRKKHFKRKLPSGHASQLAQGAVLSPKEGLHLKKFEIFLPVT